MKTTPYMFRLNPQPVYRHADLGGTVEIEHKLYPDRIFELTAKPKEIYSALRGLDTDKIMNTSLIGMTSSEKCKRAQQAVNEFYSAVIEEAPMNVINPFLKASLTKAIDEGILDE